MLFRLIVSSIVLLGAAQTTAQPFEGYVTTGAGGGVHRTGGRGTLLSAAAGGEWLASRHVGVGGEGGVLVSPRGDLATTLAVDARLHLLGATPRGRWAPYLLAGYTPLRFFEASDQGLHIGGGVDYRLSPGRAIRVEVRDILRRGGSISTHYWTVRVGLTFR